MFQSDAALERRKSLNSLAARERWRPRSASVGIIEVSPLNRGFSQRGPATPCFASPRMGFSSQFGFDSPIQVLTSSSPGVFRPMSVPALPARCSLRNLPHRCKILLTVVFLSMAACLYYFRNLRDVKMQDYQTHEHPSIESFLRTVEGPNPLHTLTADLDNPNIEVPYFYGVSEVSEVLSKDSSSENSLFNEVANQRFEQLEGPLSRRERDVPIKVVGSDFKPGQDGYGDFSNPQVILSGTHQGWDENKDLIPEQNPPIDGVIESASFAQQPLLGVNSRDGALYQADTLETNEKVENKHYSYGSPQYAQRSFKYSQQTLSQREIEARMTKHTGSEFRRGIPGLLNAPRDFRGSSSKPLGSRMNVDGMAAQKRSKEGLRMDRLPPGINPRKYRTEF